MSPSAKTRSHVDETMDVLEKLVEGAHGKFVVSEGRVAPSISKTRVRQPHELEEMHNKIRWTRFRSKIWRILTRNNWVRITARTKTPEGWLYFFAASEEGFHVVMDTFKTSKNPAQTIERNLGLEGQAIRIDAFVQAVPTDDEEGLAAYGFKAAAILSWKRGIGTPWLHALVRLAAYMRADLNYLIRGAKPARSHPLLAVIPAPQEIWERALAHRVRDAILEIRLRKRLRHGTPIEQIMDACGSVIKARMHDMIRGRGVALETDLLRICNTLDRDAHELLTGAKLHESLDA